MYIILFIFSLLGMESTFKEECIKYCIEPYIKLKDSFINMQNVTDELDSIQLNYDDLYHTYIHELILNKNKNTSFLAEKFHNIYCQYHSEIFNLQNYGEYSEKKEIKSTYSQHILYKFNDTGQIISKIDDMKNELMHILDKLAQE